MQSADETQQARLARIRDGLLGWFKEHARDLPWRRTRDPYAILVSEVMLQQTQVDRVLPYYTRFLERFPTVEDLAAAATSDVIRIWSGLGYNRRAVNLQRAARAVVDELGGSFPDDPADLKKLPGIGAYTAGAIAAFAHERDVAFLDTNMRRVISRVIFGTESARESDALEAANALVPPGHGWTWNQALIEFGALQCTARRPACIICPLRDECAAYPTMQVALQVSPPARVRRKPSHSRALRASTEGESWKRCEHCPRMSQRAFPSPSLASECGRGSRPRTCHGYANWLMACNATGWRSSRRILHRTMRITKRAATGPRVRLP